MKGKKIIVLINVLTVLAMIIHITVNMVLHAAHPEYSAPVYVELFVAVFYLPPLAVIDTVYFIIKKLR